MRSKLNNQPMALLGVLALTAGHAQLPPGPQLSTSNMSILLPHSQMMKCESGFTHPRVKHQFARSQHHCNTAVYVYSSCGGLRSAY